MNYKTTVVVLIVAAIFISGFTTNNVKSQNYQSTVFFQDTIKKNKAKTEAQAVQVDSFVNQLFLSSKLYKKSAHASYYHDKFNGRKTSSGTRFSNNSYTAAHRKLPFGTRLKITNEDNGKSVVVKVTDRGPFTKGRDIDLTSRAFKEIASKRNDGSMIVTIELVH